MRFSFAWNKTQNATYLQFVGEDEAGGIPSRGMLQLGLESSFSYNDVQHRFVLEAIDTSLAPHKTPIYNRGYEHSIYQSGYRYKARPIGAPVDNDT